MPEGEFKTSEDLIREAHGRLQSPRHESEAETRREPEPTASQQPEPLEYRSSGQTLTEPPADPYEYQLPSQPRFSGRWVGWAITVLVFAGWGLFTSLDDANRDSGGEIVAGGDLDVWTLQVGDCFNDPDEFGELVYDVAAVPCSQPHDNEVFALHSVAGAFTGEFPGVDALEQHGYEACSGAMFDDYVGISYLDSSLDVFTMTPSEESWRQGDREVVCALYRVDFTKLTGTARGTGL